MGTEGVGASASVQRWHLGRRHRFVDRLVAVGCTLPTMLFLIVPGAITNEAGAVSPSLLFELLVPDARSDSPDAGLLELDHDSVGMALFLGLGLAATVVTVWAVWVRRRHPEILLGLGVALLALFGVVAPIAIGLYTYAAWFTARRNLVIWSALAAAALATGLQFASVSIFFIMGGIVVPAILGLWIGTRRLLVVNLRERAEQLEREQHLLAERAAAEERTRIAREMHDVVAHRVSLMVLHAGGLEVAASEPVAVETAGVIRTTGREALTELRGVLGVLRSDGEAAPMSPQPMLADLEQLVSGWRTAGMTVRLAVTGDIRPLPSPTERAAYRVVQEALTNAAKHAPGAAVGIRLRHSENVLDVVVDNDPVPPATPPISVPSSGFGLVGLHERLSLAEGALTIGPMPSGGWRVQASIPITAPSTNPGEHPQ